MSPPFSPTLMVKVSAETTDAAARAETTAKNFIFDEITKAMDKNETMECVCKCEAGEQLAFSKQGFEVEIHTLLERERGKADLGQKKGEGRRRMGGKIGRAHV